MANNFTYNNKDLKIITYNGKDVKVVEYTEDASVAATPVWGKPFSYNTGTLPKGISSINAVRISSPNAHAELGIISDGKIYYGDTIYFTGTPDSQYLAPAFKDAKGNIININNPLIVSNDISASDYAHRGLYWIKIDVTGKNIDDDDSYVYIVSSARQPTGNKLIKDSTLYEGDTYYISQIGNSDQGYLIEDYQYFINSVMQKPSSTYYYQTRDRSDGGSIKTYSKTTSVSASNSMLWRVCLHNSTSGTEWTVKEGDNLKLDIKYRKKEWKLLLNMKSYYAGCTDTSAGACLDYTLDRGLTDNTTKMGEARKNMPSFNSLQYFLPWDIKIETQIKYGTSQTASYGSGWTKNSFGIRTIRSGSIMYGGITGHYELKSANEDSPTKNLRLKLYLSEQQAGSLYKMMLEIGEIWVYI